MVGRRKFEAVSTIPPVGCSNKNAVQGTTMPQLTLAFSPDGQTLASGGEDQTIKLWDVETQQCHRTLLGHTAMVQSIAFSPDGLPR